MTSIFRKTAFAFAAALPLCSFALQRTDLLPPQGQAYVRVSDTVRFWEKLRQSSVGRLWVDQQFQDFLGNPEMESWHTLFFDSESSAENEVWLDQMKMLTGEVILAFDTQSENIYIIANMSEEDFERGLELDENLRSIMENPFDIVHTSFQGVEIIQHVDSPGTETETLSWQAHVGRTFVMGYNREWVEQCIVRLKNDDITEPAGHPVLNLKIPIRQMLLDSIGDDPADQEDRRLFDAMGLLGVNAFTSRVEMRDEEMVIHNNLSIEDLQQGLFKALDTQPSELPTVEFIPENISSLEVGRINLFGLWKEIPVMLSRVNPASQQQFDMMLSMFRQQTGIDPEQDLLSHLGTKFLTYSTVEGDRQTTVIALELKDGMAFKQGLESGLTAPAMQPYVSALIDESDFLDHTIYTPKNADDPTDIMGIAVTDEYLLYGDPRGLRQAIRGIASSGAANTAFEQTELVQGLRAQVAPSAFGFSAIDWKKSMDVILAELTKPEYTTAIQQKWALSGSPLPPPDFDKLPPADHIAQYFNISYQYIEATDDGLHQKIILKY
ncbi:hypothetical protein [Pontiella sp.]|uniref:hypothetical protein n=1 Tax=Pontiella sp. TaxID=2837462 RepID=UPI0035659DB5